MAITKQINIIPDDSMQRIHVSQGDIGRTLQFVLYEGSTSYTIPTGATVKIQGTKPSGLGFSETCTWSGSTVTIDTTETMTSEFGGIPTELQITDGTDVLGTSNFLLIVERNPHPDNTTDGTQITAQSLQVQINELASYVENELYSTTTTVTDNFIEDDSSFWNQGAYNNSVAYMVHSDAISITNHSNLYFGGICDGTLLTANGYMRLRYFDSNDNLLYTGGTKVLGTSWVHDGTTALIDYPTTAYIIVEFSTNSGSVSVNPTTFANNYKLYVGYTHITSFDDWYDHEVTTTTSNIETLEESIDALEENIDTLDERVTVLEDGLPTYWQSYMDSKIATLRELDGTIGTHGFSFAFITDVHWANNYKHAPRLIEYILEKTAVNTVICGGDILTKNSSISDAMNIIYDWDKSTSDYDTINIFGNHDNNSNDGNSSSLWIGYDRWYGTLLKRIENNITVWSDDKKYFYIDNNAQKVRMFFMNTGYDQGSTLDNTQAGWLQSKLYELGEGWSAIVFQHMFFVPATVASGTTELTLHTAGTLSKHVIDSQIAGMTNRGAEFIGVVCGHVHRDYAITTENGYPVIATTCDANGTQASLYDNANPTRTSGTTTEQAFDIYHIDTDSKTIYVTRIGAGSDRVFNYSEV